MPRRPGSAPAPSSRPRNARSDRIARTPHVSAAAGEGRPKRFDPDWSRGAILDAADDLFQRQGFAPTTIAQIADQAGVAKGLVLHHFTSKEEVLRQVIARVIPTLLASVDSPSATPDVPAEEMLRHSLRQIYHNLVEEPKAKDLLRLLVAEGRRHPKLVDYYHDEVVLRGGQGLAAIVSHGHARGEFRLPGDEALAAVLLGPVIGMLFRRMLFGGRDDAELDHLIDRHLDVVLNGLHAT